eukprot:TRINITY_DN58029_c0_g1_i1.p1 TRINITY_DN58029_c0_g1~~TRINITY_DN58029_c0_g1_i1.p1  ORF type:complete len:607 (+),score=53.90 TRINITY_DN58029_c0_g1_i1:55-1875(+)
MGCRVSKRRLTEELRVKPRHVVAIIGAPASGKGTQCDRIVETYGLVHVSPEEMLRDNIKRGTELGVKAQAYQYKELSIPTDLIFELIEMRICQQDVVEKGCLIENFPTTDEQAKAMKNRISVDRYIYLDVPKSDILTERALGRRLDPETGGIYHLKFHPAPLEILGRLVSRPDDLARFIQVRVDTFQNRIKDVLHHIGNNVIKIDGTLPADDVFIRIMSTLDELVWTTTEKPYFGNIAFHGPFCNLDAHRAGFFSEANPPEVGENVVSFKRGEHLGQRGVVGVPSALSNLSMRLTNHGSPVNTLVQVTTDSGVFSIEPVFLAPVNDCEYTSLCTTAEMERSCFMRHYPSSNGIGDADVVLKAEARASLQKWLKGLHTSDGTPIDIPEGLLQTLLTEFDEHDSPAIYLYSANHRLGQRTSRSSGQDYSVYYKALNNTLNNDESTNLQNAMVLIHRMIYVLLYDEATHTRLHHEGGRVWKGDAQPPVPLNMHKLKEAHRLGQVIRFRQFQSTTTDKAVADKYRRREDGKGYLWGINIPPNFWGARDIKALAWKAKESETLFPPYSAFLVESVDDDCCLLTAVDRSTEIGEKAARHGLHRCTENSSVAV